jgi:hypothetical protein
MRDGTGKFGPDNFFARSTTGGTHMPAVLLMITALLGTPPLSHEGLPPQNAAYVDYEAFMAKGLADRVRDIRKLSPENRAEILSTHIRRWRDKNGEGLNADQRRIVAEWLAHVTPDLYREPGLQEKLQRTRELEKKSEAFFSREEIVAAFTLGGSYIPAAK